MHIIKNILVYLQQLPLVYRVVGGVIAVGIVIMGVHVATRTPASDVTPPTVAHVTIASVASLSNQSGPLPVVGSVSSVSKASILAQSSGEIVSLPHALGDRVAAGEVLASFENSSQRAAVLQAQGGYDSAKAALAKASGTTATNSGVTSNQAAQSAQNAATAASAALKSAYASIDDAVHTKADALFSNPHGLVPALNLSVPDSQLVSNIQNERTTLDTLVSGVNTLSLDTSPANIDSNITTVLSNAQTVGLFLADLITAINKAVPSGAAPAGTIAGYQTSIGAARSEVLGAISSLTAAKSAYDNALSSATVASNSASSVTTNDIASAEANVKSALGGLNAAQANLEKTVIRAPISGTIVSLPITLGGYVSSFSPVAQISNPSALEVDTYVTADDAKTLAVGSKAIIDDSTHGVIVFIAPALDPSTGKIEIKIGIPDKSALTDGDTVSVSLVRSTANDTKTPAHSAITIPIAAAKITPSGPVVFTVSSSTLVSNPVVFGTITGSQVEVLSGLTQTMDIVIDARGLSDGQQVVVDPTQ